MTRSKLLESSLFWIMITLAAAALAPALILPAWIEYRAQLARRDVARVQRDAVAERLHRAEKELDHLNHDPAYILRLAEDEFGDSIDLPEQEPVLVAPSPTTQPARAGVGGIGTAAAAGSATGGGAGPGADGATGSAAGASGVAGSAAGGVTGPAAAAAGADDRGLAPDGSNAPGSALPELATFVDDLRARYPQMDIFVAPEKRRYTLIIGVALLAGAILLITRGK